MSISARFLFIFLIAASFPGEIATAQNLRGLHSGGRALEPSTETKTAPKKKAAPKKVL